MNQTDPWDYRSNDTQEIEMQDIRWPCKRCGERKLNNEQAQNTGFCKDCLEEFNPTGFIVSKTKGRLVYFPEPEEEEHE